MNLYWKYLGVLLYIFAWKAQELTAVEQNDPTKHDIVFVVDKSGSIGRRKFEFVKDFLEMFIEYFPVFPAKTRVAIVSFSTYVRLEFDFNEHKNKECLRNGIRKMRYTSGRTSTGNALELVRDKLVFNTNAGARQGTKKIIFVITDGRSNLGIAPGIPAGELKKNSNVSIVALGVTSKINQTELEIIASSPSDVFHLKNFAALNNLTQSLRKDLSRKCKNGSEVLDECGRRCKCKDGILVDCCRQRKEFTQLTEEERIRYISTLMIAATDPKYQRTYNQLLTLHIELFRRIHIKEYFLPWHRWFLLQFENLLQRIDCRVTLPYWDWTRVAANPFSSDLWSTGETGFGGNGSPPGGCVKTGPFQEGNFSLIRGAGGGCLKRDFNGRSPDAIALASLLSSTPDPDDFEDFESQLRVVFHNELYCRIGGTMCTGQGAGAPEFILHHAFIDKIWADWQSKGEEHKFNAFFKNQQKKLPATNYRSREFLDLRNQPDCICAEYVDVVSNVSMLIKDLSLSELQNIPRLALPSLSTNATELFRTSSAELAKVSKLQAAVAPKNVVTVASLNGTDGANLGFRPIDVVNAKGSV